MGEIRALILAFAVVSCVAPDPTVAEGPGLCPQADEEDCGEPPGPTPIVESDAGVLELALRPPIHDEMSAAAREHPRTRGGPR